MHHSTLLSISHAPNLFRRRKKAHKDVAVLKVEKDVGDLEFSNFNFIESVEKKALLKVIINNCVSTALLKIQQ